MLCNMTYLSKSVTLTLDDLRSNFFLQNSDFRGVKSISVDPPWGDRREKHDSGKVIALSQIA